MADPSIREIFSISGEIDHDPRTIRDELENPGVIKNRAREAIRAEFARRGIVLAPAPAERRRRGRKGGGK